MVGVFILALTVCFDGDGNDDAVQRRGDFRIAQIRLRRVQRQLCFGDGRFQLRDFGLGGFKRVVRVFQILFAGGVAFAQPLHTVELFFRDFARNFSGLQLRLQTGQLGLGAFNVVFLRGRIDLRDQRAFFDFLTDLDGQIFDFPRRLRADRHQLDRLDFAGGVDDLFNVFARHAFRDVGNLLFGEKGLIAGNGGDCGGGD